MLLRTQFLAVCEAKGASVFIPLSELGHRSHELPPPYQMIQVVGDCPEAYGALGWLHAHNRPAEIVPPESVPPALTGVRYRLWEPNAFLQEIVDRNPYPHLCPLAIDVGCGSGREAVYLADKGMRVIAIDRLPDALARGHDLQTRYAPESPPIEWLCLDVERSVWQPSERVQLVCLFFFFSQELVLRAWDWLVPGGWLIVEAFTEQHRQHYGRPASCQRVSPKGALVTLVPSGSICHFSEGWRESGRHTARLWAVKPPP